MICSVPLNCPDEFIPNTNVVRNRSTNPDTPPTRVSDVHDTSGMTPPPLDTLSVKHSEPVFHPRMNSSSELIASLEGPICGTVSDLDVSVQTRGGSTYRSHRDI